MIHSYPWYITDWRESEAVATMTYEQRGLYRELLDLCWREGSLPNDEAILRRLTFGDSDEFQRCWPAVRRQFEERDGRLWNRKVDEKRPEVLDAKERFSNAGKSRAAKAKREKGRFVSSDAGKTVDSTQPAKHQPVPSPSPSPSPVETTKTVVSTAPLPPTGGLAVVHRSSDIDAEQWREYLGVFTACGKGLNEQDQAKALRLWLSIETAERVRALADARARAMREWRSPDLTAMPANHLRDKPWTRTAGPRMLPEVREPTTMSAGERRDQAVRDGIAAMLERKRGRVA